MSTYVSKSLNEVLGQGESQEPDPAASKEPEPEVASTAPIAKPVPETSTAEEKASMFSSVSSVDILKKHGIFNSTTSMDMLVKSEDLNTLSMGSAPNHLFKSNLSSAGDPTSTHDMFASTAWATSLKEAHEDVTYVPSIFSSSIVNSSPVPNSADTGENQTALDATAKAPTNLEEVLEKKLAPFGKKPVLSPSLISAQIRAVSVVNAKKRSTDEMNAAVDTVIKTPKASKANTKQVDGGPKKFIKGIYTDNDVLMGKGGRSNHHAGNKRYLHQKTQIQPRYKAASKEEKTSISQELVDAVHSWGGRFLKKDTETDTWYEVDNKTARKKASQTLREDNTAESRAAKRARYHNRLAEGGAGGVQAETVESAALDAAQVVVESAAAIAENSVQV